MARIKSTTEPQEFSSLSQISKEAGEKNDCAVKAIAIACDVPYAIAHETLAKLGRESRRGTINMLTMKAIISLGFKIIDDAELPRKIIRTYPGIHSRIQNVTTHHPRRFPESFKSVHPNMLFVTSRHILAVRNGQVIDWSINRSLRVNQIWQIEKRL